METAINLGLAMLTRTDLENQVMGKLASLSNEDAQRIAEDYVQIRYPKLFPQFGFRALSPEGKSRPGWPDGSAVGPDGKIYGVEATHTANRKRVAKHLEEYLEKARALGSSQLGGFIHVSVSPKASFSPTEIKIWQDKFVEAGFARDKVELVFGTGLSLALTQPEFARTRIEVLGIQDLPTYFRLYRSKVGPDEERLGVSFVPNWEDFERGTVHRPEVTQVVAQRLNRDRTALVRGIGASGKTVMAWLLAQDFIRRGFPAYSFDFSSCAELTPDVVNGLIVDLKRFAHPDVLFVLDNIHLEEPKAKELFLAWKEIPLPQRPRFLLVGRETRTAKGSAISELELEVLPLRARQAELRGVFRRLALREYSEDQLPEPPEAELTNWLRTFGGDPSSTHATADLIVFSAAVVRRMHDLVREQWQLTKHDAVEQVRDVYLSKVTPQEQENLFRLCLLEEFELGLPSEALAHKMAALTKSNTKLGIVFRDEIGAKKQLVSYRLVHAALGELLLAAAEDAIDRPSLLRAVAMATPAVVFKAAARMVRAGRESEARILIAELIAKPGLFLKYDGLQVIQKSLELARRLKVELPREFRALPIGEPEDRERLVSIALQTPLNELVMFLRSADVALEPAPQVLRDELLATKNWPRVIDKAVESPLNLLDIFLGYAETELKPLVTAMSTELWTGKNRVRVIEIALQARVSALAGFLRTAERALQPLHSGLRGYLSSVEGRRVLAGKLMDEGEDELVSVLTGDSADIFREAFLQIDLLQWDKRRTNGAPQKLDAFVKFQKVLSGLGRAEFAAVPAGRIVKYSTTSDWHRPGIGLHHVSHVLRLAKGLSGEQQADFVRRVATPEWLDSLYATVQAGGLAGNLLALAKALPPTLFRQFHRETLSQRISRELRAACDAKSYAEALSLLGAASIIGVERDAVQIAWPDVGELENVLRIRAPSPDKEVVGDLEVQLWCGIRIMAAGLERPYPLPPELGDRVLELWRATQARLDRHELPKTLLEIDYAITSWLQACRSAGWTLVPK